MSLEIYTCVIIISFATGLLVGFALGYEYLLRKTDTRKESEAVKAVNIPIENAEYYETLDRFSLNHK